MTPAPGEHLVRYLGDRIQFTLTSTVTGSATTAFLRTNLGRAQRLRDETITALGGTGTFAGASWRDIPMRPGPHPGSWQLDLALTEIGHFQAKAYLTDETGAQYWPAGSDSGISIHPSEYRTANTIYCAFTRMFGASKIRVTTTGEQVDPLREQVIGMLDHEGYAVIPPSGTFRDLVRELPHIVQRLHCRILHLLPVGPTPTTYARYGRFGSPYAQLDLTAIDPALVEFDKRTTAIDQFGELTAAAQRLGCRVFLDIVINHTGWGSTLIDEHPEWFKRQADGTFHSPGAWGNTWEDLVELEHRDPALWETIAAALITWCRRGVNGFRCDAGYMVPLKAWQYIICRVRQEFPRTVFLLEGLGGAWEATSALLTVGGMQWAYSELFQNYEANAIASYLDHCHGPAAKLGVLVHYSETHDNDRLAKQSRAWSLLRNRLSALTSQCGAYGFTAGVEWLATEKLAVHQSRGMSWGASDNLLPELTALNRLLAEDPVFFDGSSVERLADAACGVIALLRRAQDASDRTDHREVLILINPDRGSAHEVALPERCAAMCVCDLLGQNPPTTTLRDGFVIVSVPPLTAWCLAPAPVPAGTGDRYRRLRAQAGAAYAALGMLHSNEHLGPCDWRELARWMAEDPVRLLAAATHLDRSLSATDLMAAVRETAVRRDLPPVASWSSLDVTRIVPVPPGAWILVRDECPFRVSLTGEGGIPRHAEAVEVDHGWVAVFPPSDTPGSQRIELVRGGQAPVAGTVLRLAAVGDYLTQDELDLDGRVLLTNGRGGMCRLAVDLGTITSKYDCLLAANLHPSAPSDRHVLAKRLRVWVSADGFITALDRANLTGFEAGPPARWRFNANAGDGRMVGIELTIDMLAERNTVVIQLARPDASPVWGMPLPAAALVKLIVRIDVEDRSFHSETARSATSAAHFSGNTRALQDAIGFDFRPAPERGLRVTTATGTYHHEEEWCIGIPHPVEASRGMTPAGDCWSPGWFDIPLSSGAIRQLVLCGDPLAPAPAEIEHFSTRRQTQNAAALRNAGFPASDRFGTQLAIAAQAYVVRRGRGRSVIAGYPWFLDWGRDTFISARGLLAAGMIDIVGELLTTFGRFEEKGTLPNLLNGDRAENRDTSDAPLWYAVVLEELAALHPAAYATRVDDQRTLGDVVRSIACGYLAGTPNGIRVDPESKLVWSPPHFTWMDTNYPACTPRAGYPIEIQVLWLRLLRQLARQGLAPAPDQPPWGELAETALASFLRCFWLPERGYLADVLLAPTGTPAAVAVRDDALRPNQIFAVSLGVISGDLARRVVAACYRHLAVPGGVRSLAPLPVSVPLVLRSADGRPLNDPYRPYWGHYLGDEDTRRKPAYHNGTVWTWPFPSLCEAVAMAWDRSPTALATARALLGSSDQLLHGGCVGQIPEILDGDAPHTQRGCDAQAWGVTETLRVWKLLAEPLR